MLTAHDIQIFLGIPENTVIAHGYSYCRHFTFDIWFCGGKIYRSESEYGKKPILLESTNFEVSYFFDNVKRWYGSGINSKIVEFFETVGKNLPITPGGHYPYEPPC